MKKIKCIPSKDTVMNEATNIFKCPHCQITSRFSCKLETKYPLLGIDSMLITARCDACSERTIFLISGQDEFQLFPDLLSDIPQPNKDMPEEVKKIYREATKVFKDSPRASAALSRLAIDQLTLQFSGRNNLNSRIADMVSNGLSPTIQKALDTVRVIGNNAVHPGTIDLNDNPELALSLLELVNLIVDKQISEPKKIQEMYDRLPNNNLEAIKKRDSK